MTPYEKWRRARSGLEGTDILLRSGPGFQIVPELDVAPGDIIVDKTCNGAFTYTDFEHVLRSQGITHLLLSGCTTDVCVHTTLQGSLRPQLPVPDHIRRLRQRRSMGARGGAPHGHGRERHLRSLDRFRCRPRGPGQIAGKGPLTTDVTLPGAPTRSELIHLHARWRAKIGVFKWGTWFGRWVGPASCASPH